MVAPSPGEMPELQQQAGPQHEEDLVGGFEEVKVPSALL